MDSGSGSIPMDPEPVEMDPEPVQTDSEPAQKDPESIQKDPEPTDDRNVFEKIAVGSSPCLDF